MHRWFINKFLKGVIKRERKRQVKLGYTRDSDDTKGIVNLLIIARWFEESGKYVQALAIVEAATESNRRIQSAR